MGSGYAICSYLVTRGPDGELLAFSAFFGVLCLFYIVICWRQRRSFATVLVDLLVFEASGVIGMVPAPRLDEMAGVLYLLVPSAILATAICGGFVACCAKRFVGEGTERGRNYSNDARD